MDSTTNIKHRTTTPEPDHRDRDTIAKSRNDDMNRDVRAKRGGKRTAMAKRGVRSLAIAVAIPISLTLFTIYFFGAGSSKSSSSSSSSSYASISKPFWFPPSWALHLTCLGSSFLMGLSAWLVWAESGFHKNPTALWLYLAQFGLGLAWEPVVFWMGWSGLGLIMCLGMFGALVGCSRQFKEMNPIAGDLVKPCLAWAAFLAIINLKLAFI